MKDCMSSKTLSIPRSSKKNPGPLPENHGRDGRPQKVGIVSLGCPKNLVDSEVMMGLLARAGAELCPRAEDADVIVVNTCSFIERSEDADVIVVNTCSFIE